MILGSDGLWDMCSNAKAVSVAQSHYPNAPKAAAALILLATKQWKVEEVSCILAAFCIFLSVSLSASPAVF